MWCANIKKMLGLQQKGLKAAVVMDDMTCDVTEEDERDRGIRRKRKSNNRKSTYRRVIRRHDGER